MQYKKFGDRIVARIDKGEEILEQLEILANNEGIKLATIQAIGATDDFTVGVFDTKAKKYRANNFSGDFEILSLLGTITTMNGKYYPHLHMSAGDENGQVYGGHLNRAVISATCEMIITILPGNIDRELDKNIGINLFKF